MLGGKSVIMAGVYLRGDLVRRSDATEGGKEAALMPAINIGR